MEVEAITNECGGGVGQARCIRVGSGARCVGVAAESVEWWLDPDTALAATALGGGFLGRRICE